MNLLKDPWIPVRVGAEFKQINYKELLCSEQPELQVALPRDDLELACIQMLAAITQVIFMPDSPKMLRERVRTPLVEDEFDLGVKSFINWFDMEHPEWPFMQVNDPGTKDPTPVQKLFPGLPAGNNHAFFNENDEYANVCPSCAAIGLFNLCTQTPNISGKHKGGLRGGAPVSTMVYNSMLRKMIWMNVLTTDIVNQVFKGDQLNVPVWKAPINSSQKIAAASIGIARGLFWTPILVRFVTEISMKHCDCCNVVSEKTVNGLLLGSNFKYDIIGLWPHPYSPRQLNLQREVKGGKEKPPESIVSFRNSEPAWTQFSELLFQSEKTEKTPGYTPAAVVRQYHQMFSDKAVSLIIGGYRNKQAAILQRRHELYTIPAGWNDDFRDRIVAVVEIGIASQKLLVDKVLYPLVKGNKDKGVKGIGVPINSKASTYFFHLTEPLIHRMLRETSLREFIQSKNEFIAELSRICLEIFEHVTQPYSIKPDLVGPIALAREKLRRLLKELYNSHQVTGGTA